MDTTKSWNVEDKIILVTGGAAGIGAALVRQLLHLNARHVAFLDIAEREGGVLEAELLNKFGALRAKFIKCDVSDEAQLSVAYKQVLDKYRRLDIVVNNAAVISDDASFYKKMVDINFTATVSSTIKALEYMSVDKERMGGVILNMSSLLALKPATHLPVYSATKTAVLQFSNYIATPELYEKTRVRIITICLGPTDTAIIHKPNNLAKDSQLLTSRVPERQRVNSAVTGMLDVISRAENATTWIIAEDKPAVDVTMQVRNGFKTVAEATELFRC